MTTAAPPRSRPDPAPALRVRTEVISEPRALLDLVPDLPRGQAAVAWVRQDEGLVGWGEAVRLTPGRGDARFARAEQALAALADDAEVADPVGLPGTGLVALGSFTFDADDPGSVLIVPRIVVGRRDGVTWLTRIDPRGPTGASTSAGTAAPGPASSAPASSAPASSGPASSGHTSPGSVAAHEPPAPRSGTPPPPHQDRPRYAGSSQPDLHWLEAVAEAIGLIEAGEVAKVVLARDHAVWAREPFDAVALARRLTARFASCHTFVVDGLVGATPELLLARNGDRVVSRVLAGTAARGPDPASDARLGAALLASDKDRTEHRLAAESVADVLAPRCRVLQHDPEPELLRLDNVQHLATLFTGDLDVPASALELVAALHPTAAVGGTPRRTAIEVIRRLEGMERGRYAGPVGWTDPSGDGEWGIALRCAQLSGARARLFAGVGIVGASLPEAELEETRLKLLAMQAALDATPGR